MIRVKQITATLAAAFLSVFMAAAQSSQAPPAEGLVLSKPIQAIGYQVGGGGTTIDLRGTGVVAGATGEAKVESKQGVTNIEIKAKGLSSPISVNYSLIIAAKPRSRSQHSSRRFRWWSRRSRTLRCDSRAN